MILQQRIPGAWKDRVWIAPDFDAESEEINSLFYDDSTMEPIVVNAISCREASASVLG